MKNINTDLKKDDQLWESILIRLKSTFLLAEEDMTSYKENRLLRMFAVLPSIAECPNPEAVGFLNTSVYLAERRGGKDLFLHTEQNDEDPLSRLKPFEQLMSQGNPDIVRKGLLHAAIVMVNDYHTDRTSDFAEKKYNPIVNKRWDYGTMLEELRKAADRIFCPRLNLVFSAEEAGLYGFWIGGSGD